MRRSLARLGGRRSSWIVVGVWVALVVAFASFGSKVPEITNDEYGLPGKTQTALLGDYLRERFPGGDQRTALIVYHREGGLTEDDKARIARNAEAVAEVERVARPLPPFAADSPPGFVSADGAVAFTVVPIEAPKVFRVTPTIEALRELTGGDGLETHVTGFPAITSDYNTAIKDADVTLLGATVLLVLILLIAVYRSPILALVPLVVVGVAYAVVSGAVYVLNQAFGLPVDNSSTSLLLVLMFGAGTDYCLLFVARYRARLAAGDPTERAVREALREAGPAMIASGLTVVAALVVMLAGIFGVNRTLGPVNAIGVTVVLIASLTLLPAVLRLLGPRAFWPRKMTATPASVDGDAGGRWAAIGSRVRRRPALWLAISVVLLGAGTSGLALWQTDLNPVAQFRTANDASEGFELVRSAFPPGTVNPTNVLVERPDGAIRDRDIASVRRRVLSVPGVVAVLETGRRSIDGRAALLSATYADDPFAAKAIARTQRIRDVVEESPGLRVLVGGGSGERLDVRNATIRDLKVIVPLVLLVVLITLIVLLRALVAPLVLLVTVVASFAATLGTTLFVFRFVFGQDGFNTALPLIVFIFLVALGSDYNIFLMSRVREESERHGTREGMLRALVATGPVITSAGLVLAGTFAVLTIIPSYDLGLIGFAVALGVLVDTFVVRSICVPAIVWCLGERTWLPSRLR